MTIIGILIALLVLSQPAVAGKGHGDDADNDHGHGQTAESDAHTISVTQWTDDMELFMEYPVMVANTPGRFIIHLTILDGFQPVRGGRVTLKFTDATGHSHNFKSVAVVRDGIFAPTIALHDAGPQQFTLVYEGDDIRDEFQIDGFVVHASAEEIPAPEDESQTNEIGFLKEQQWKIPFATVNAEVRSVQRGVWAIGEVLPSPKAYAEVIAPVDGVVQVASEENLALPGSSVGRGDVLATITPPAQGDGWVGSRLAFEQARRDYERAQRLKDLDAISARDYELARNEFQARKANFESVSAGSGANALPLTAPISGKIIDWNLRPGQLVRSGDKLMSVVDPSVVWLKVNVYENDFRNLGTPTGAFINADGDGWALSEKELKVLTSGGALDPTTRTIPVLLEIRNDSGRLTINESTPVELYSSDGVSSVAVPRSAVYEDGGLDIVFVQTGGESFEKRQVTVGPHHAGWVSILSGISEGERIVSRGGYHVKLASTSSDIGHGHTH